MKDKKRKIIPVLILIISLCVTVMMISMRPNAESVKESYISPAIEVDPVSLEKIDLQIISQGSVVPKIQIVLKSEVSGKIDWVAPNFQNGARFDSGDVLIKLDKRDYELALIQAESNFLQAKINYDREIAKSDLAKKEWEIIGDNNEVSDLTLRKPQLDQAKVLLSSAEASLEQARRNLLKTEISIPFNAILRSKNVDIGMILTPAFPIATIYNVDKYEISLPIPERDLHLLNIPLDGRAIADEKQLIVNLSANFGDRVKNWTGKIIRTASEIDYQTRMLSLIAEIAEPLKQNSDTELPLKVGMFLEAKIIAKSVSDIVIVPRYTIKDDKIWVLDNDGVLNHKIVNILHFQDNLAIVDRGLNKNESVLLTKLDLLISGTKFDQVKVVE